MNTTLCQVGADHKKLKRIEGMASNRRTKKKDRIKPMDQMIISKRIRKGESDEAMVSLTDLS